VNFAKKVESDVQLLPSLAREVAQALAPGTPIPYIVEKGAKAMVDLVGIEPNPGPSKSKVGKVNPPGQGQSKTARRRRRENQRLTQGQGSDRQGRVSGSTSSQPMIVSQPTSVGTVIPKSTFAMCGQPNVSADQDRNRGLKVRGTGLFSAAVATGAGSAVSGWAGGTAWEALTPSKLEPRLVNFETIFNWYCIRSCRFTYIPACSSSTSGALAIGVTTDYQESVEFANPTTMQVLELDSAVMTPVWQPASVLLVNRGSKLYETYASAESADTRCQGAIAASLSNANVSTTYGYVYVEYEVDFYEPTPVQTSVV